MKIEVDFKLASDELPKRSGKYLCSITFDELHTCYFSSLDYSSKHKLFNANDHEIIPASGFSPNDVLWWADINEIRYALGEIGVDEE